MPNITGADIVNQAEHYSGVKYFEGNPQDPAHGFDCSGLVQRVMADLGVPIARTTSAQLAEAAIGNHNPVGKNIGTDIKQALQGDILHYVGHEEIWIGGGYVFSEATPGTVAAVRKQTPWPIIGIVRYANAGPGAQVGSLGQTQPGQVTSQSNVPPGGDPGQVHDVTIADLVPGLNGVISFLGSIAKFFGDVGNPGFWKRVGIAFLGAMFLLLGAYGMMHRGQTIDIQTAGGIVSKVAQNGG